MRDISLIISNVKDLHVYHQHNVITTWPRFSCQCFLITYGSLCRKLASTASTVQWCRQKAATTITAYVCVGCTVQSCEDEFFAALERGVKRWCPSEQEHSLKIQACHWKRLSNLYLLVVESPTAKNGKEVRGE